MQLFYTTDLSGDRLELTKEESKHVVKVLRKKEGDKLHFTDGIGTLAEAEVITADPKHCVLEIMSHEKHEAPHPELTIACAPTKSNDRFEWFLEKSTEIGITHIIPFICERSERKVVKYDRLQKVIVSAMKQSTRTYLPELAVQSSFDEVVNHPFDGRKFIAYCDQEGRTEFKDTIEAGENALVLIGPEGDFTDKEIKQALAAGFEPISLGASRLRTETAAMVACTIFNIKNG